MLLFVVGGLLFLVKTGFCKADGQAQSSFTPFVATKDSWMQLLSSWHSVDWFLICTKSNTDRSTVSHVYFCRRSTKDIYYIDHVWFHMFLFTSGIHGLNPPPSVTHFNISLFGIPGWLRLCGFLLLQQVPSAILACTFSMHGGSTL